MEFLRRFGIDSKYLIGIDEMDAQHTRLFALAERARKVGLDEFAMNSVILNMMAYAHDHLDKEEEFLKKNGLADFERGHREKHHVFRQSSMDFYDRFRDAMDLEAKAEIVRQIVEFIDTWLKEHIHVEDRKYAQLLTKS